MSMIGASRHSGCRRGVSMFRKSYRIRFHSGDFIWLEFLIANTFRKIRGWHETDELRRDQV